MNITSLILSKKYVDDSLAGAGAVKGKSAYEVAQSNGFTGSEKDWLASLNGTTPHIGENGHWFIGEVDTGVIASPSLAGYATEDFVSAQLAKLDFSPYATKKELSTAIGKIVIPDVSGFVTQADIDKAIEAIPEVDLSSYATKEELQKAIKNIKFPEVDLTPYALKTEIPSLAGYATQSFVQQAIEDIEHPQQDLSDFAKKDEIPDTTGLASETWVKQMIAQAQLDGDQEVDLSAYPTREEVQKLVDEEIAEIVHPKPNLDGYAKTEDLSNFVTEDDVDRKIAAIPQPDLSDYAKREELPDVSKFITADDVQDMLPHIPSHEEFVTTEELEDILSERIPEIPSHEDFATKQDLQDAIENIDIPDVNLDEYAKKSDVEEAIGKIEIPEVNLDGLATEEFVREEIAKVEHPTVDLSGLATEEFVREAVEQIEIPEFDPTGLATEEFVSQKIAEAQLGGGDTEVDLSVFYTKSETEQKIKEAVDAVQHPDFPSLDEYATKEDVNEALSGLEMPSTEGLASEEFVRQEIEKIEIPSTEGLASEQFVKDEVEKISIPSIEGLASEEFVRNAINEIEIPEVDLTGMATEQFVTDAINNIEIPEAKQSSIYEVTSDEIEMEKLIPADTEFVSGDVLIVTNSTGIKSAYHFNGEDWIACDGNVDASKVIMPIDITLAGSYTQVGNLTKTSTGTAKFATKGKSVAAALQEMLSKREQPGSPTKPSISCTASGMSAVEVGTSVTPGWNASLNSGSYTYGPVTGISPKTWTITDSKGNTSNKASGSFPSFVVTDSDNYSYTVSVTHDQGAIAYDNLGDESNPVVRIAANSTAAVTKTGLKGYRQWFIYVGNNTDAIDSAWIRSKCTAKGNAKDAGTINNQAIAGGTKRVVVAIPQKVTGAQYTYGKELKSVIDVDGMNLDVIGNFTKSEVMVEGKDGATAVKYNVWVCENANGLAATKYNLVIG